MPKAPDPGLRWSGDAADQFRVSWRRMCLSRKQDAAQLELCGVPTAKEGACGDIRMTRAKSRLASAD